MTKPIITLFLLLLAVNSFGQISDLSVVASSGGACVSVGFDVSWTIGESFTGDLSNNSYLMAQGFHQGAIAVVSTDVNDLLPDNNIIAYPNPTREQITIKIAEFVPNTGWNLELLSIDGKILYTSNIESTLSTINLSSYQCGTYLIEITNNAAFSKVITIVKQ